MKIDGATTKGEECATKLLVRMNARLDFPSSQKINIKGQDGGDNLKVIRVEYQNALPKCERCKCLGHWSCV